MTNSREDRATKEERAKKIAILAEQLAIAHIMGFEAPRISRALSRLHKEQEDAKKSDNDHDSKTLH